MMGFAGRGWPWAGRDCGSASRASRLVNSSAATAVLTVTLWYPQRLSLPLRTVRVTYRSIRGDLPGVREPGPDAVGGVHDLDGPAATTPRHDVVGLAPVSGQWQPAHRTQSALPTPELGTLRPAGRPLRVAPLDRRARRRALSEPKLPPDPDQYGCNDEDRRRVHSLITSRCGLPIAKDVAAVALRNRLGSIGYREVLLAGERVLDVIRLARAPLLALTPIPRPGLRTSLQKGPRAEAGTTAVACGAHGRRRGSAATASPRRPIQDAPSFRTRDVLTDSQSYGTC